MGRLRGWMRAATVAGTAAAALGCGGGVMPSAGAQAAVQGQTAAKSATMAEGTPYSPEMLAGMLPATVYFQGRTAPLQLRNAGGASLAADKGEGHAVVWVALVDSSGYASEVQERYQFYLVTEGPLAVGGKTLPAGAYGGGFLGSRFLLMDLGGHTVAEGATETDPAMKRPRPLQVVADTASAVKLYLGRRWVELRAGSAR